MNAASWIILAIVVALVAAAIRATFFKKKSGCCHAGDTDTAGRTDARNAAKALSAEEQELLQLSCNPAEGCGDCTACQGPATARNTLQPTIKPLS